jgi:hypothetical protein
MSTPINCCDYCGKTYTRKTSFQRHYIVCEIANKSKRLKQCEEEERTDIPTIAKLYGIIQEMALRQQIMEEKMEEMQKWIDKKKKKLNIVEWLNKNFAPSILFQERVRTFTVSEVDIECLLEDTFAQTVNNILRTNVTAKTDGDDTEPFTCFSEKNSVFYIYTKSDDTKANESVSPMWTKMTTEDFSFIIKIIHSKLLQNLCAWRDVNSEKISRSDKLSDMYNKTVIKLMSVDFTQEALLSKIRQPFYTYLKGDLKNMVEYEFEF